MRFFSSLYYDKFSEMQYFNIQVASQLSGVASATIRAWEKRYNAVVPERADNKHRLYSEKDIEKLALLFRLTEFGQSIGKIAHLDLEELKNIYSSLMHRPYEELMVVTPHHERIDYNKVLNSFFLALSAYKLDIISHELEKAKHILTPRDLCLNLIVPLFYEVEKKIERNEITLAQKHSLSAIVSFHIGQLIGHHYQKSSLKEDLMLIASPEGEMNGVNLLASALLCVHYGIRFIFLGNQMPPLSLADSANTLHPKNIFIGSVQHGEVSENNLRLYLTKLLSQLKTHSQILVDGDLSPEMRRELEEKKIPFFPSLPAFDEFLAVYYSQL